MTMHIFRYLLVGLCALPVGCAGLLNDPAGSNVYHGWVSNHATPSLRGNATSEFVFQMKAVKAIPQNKASA
jgi:hypothetical protein